MLVIKKNSFSKFIICTLWLIFFMVILSGFSFSTQMNDNEASTLYNDLDNFDEPSSSYVDPLVIVIEPLQAEEALPEEPVMPKSLDEVYSYAGLIELKEVDSSFVLDIKNATTDNITGKVQYDHNLCLINIDAAKALMKAQELAMADGYRIKIWDAYRPTSVQSAMNKSLPADKKHFVPAPSNSSQHNRGIAVDVTLVDANGNELDMPTGYCEFTDATHANYKGAAKIQTKNREYLKSIMTKAGFKVLEIEWWHYYLPSYKDYEQLDLKFDDYLKYRENNSI